MSFRILSVALPLLSLFFFSAFVVAAGVNVTANCTLPSFSWTFNSIGQSPCTVAAYMLSTCYEQSYTLAPLPSGYAYDGPTHGIPNKCECSTVGYSLIAACVKCQGQEPFYWSSYAANCTSPLPLPPSQFPNPVPAGIRVPHWVTLDVTNENQWNANESYAAGDNPEYGPGAIFGASGVYTSSASASSTASSTASYTPSHSKGHAGAIAGGVIGGITIISIAVAAIFYLRRRRRSHAASAGGDAPQDSHPMLDDGMIAQSSLGSPVTMKFYDPNDPTTFPGYQGGPRSLDIHSAYQSSSLSSHVGSGSSLADMQTSPPHARGYHGLPMPYA